MHTLTQARIQLEHWGLETFDGRQAWATLSMMIMTNTEARDFACKEQVYAKAITDIFLQCKRPTKSIRFY